MSVLAPFEIWHYLSLRLATCLHRASETSYSWVSSYLTGNFSHFPFCIPFSQSNSGGLQSSILCPCLFSICIYIVRCPDRISLLNSNTVYPFVSSKFSLGYLINILTLSNKQDTCSVSVKDSPSFWLFRLKILFLALLFLSYVTPSHSEIVLALPSKHCILDLTMSHNVTGITAIHVTITTLQIAARAFWLDIHILPSPTTARVILKAKSDHVTPFFKTSKWLPISFRVKAKALSVTNGWAYHPVLASENKI